jgi:ribosomal protein L9
MPEAIRFVGEYDISVTLHADVNVDVKVVVEASEDEE